MAHPHGLVHQNLVIANIALGSLGVRSSIALQTGWTSPEASFLMKRYRMILQVTSLAIQDDGPIIIGLANGNATTTEMNTAMNQINTEGPSDPTQMLAQDNVWVIYQNTLETFTMVQDTAGDVYQGFLTTDWKSFGGKGIPNIEEAGVQVFAYNSGNGTLTTGGVVSGVVQIQGAWLRG